MTDAQPLRPTAGTGLPAAATGEGTDLDDLAAFVRRQWWLLLGLPLAVVLLSIWLAPKPPRLHQAHLAFAIDIPRSAIVIGSDEGTAAKIGEALIDDLSRMIGGDVFASAVARCLPSGVGVSAGEIASSLAATDRHRIADVTVTRALAAGATAADSEQLDWQLRAIAEAVVTELNQNAGAWFARLGEDSVVLTVIDEPSVTVLPLSLRSRLDLPIRAALAFVVALGLAAWRQATDRRLYGERDVVRWVGAPVLGAIPGRGRLRLPAVGRGVAPRAGPAAVGGDDRRGRP